MRPLEEMTEADKGKEGTEARVAGPIRALMERACFLPYHNFFWSHYRINCGNTIPKFLVLAVKLDFGTRSNVAQQGSTPGVA